MNKSDYKSKMMSILDDKSKFSRDPSSEDIQLLQGTVTANLLKLHGLNAISKDKLDSLKPSDCKFPHMYGLPKIHKPNNPLRPILSMCKSPTHKLAKWLVELLNPVKTQFCKYVLKDTFELVDVLDDSNINIMNKNMYSFDVNSLFTNVPLIKTVDILCDYISTNNFFIPFPISYLKDLLLLCTNNVRFTFEGDCFRQVDGVAMGSPLGPLLADIYMSYIENLSEDLIENVPLYRRYVDDIVVISDKPYSATSILNRMNEVQNSISLTSVEEEDNCLSFLDILLSRRLDGSIKRSIYRKPTWTGQYLNYHSFCPIRYKRGLVRCLFSRIRRICTEDTLDEEERILTQTLVDNNYPEKFIRRYKVVRTPRPTLQLAPKKDVYIKLPYMGHQNSLITRQRLNAAVKKTFYAANIIILENVKPLYLSKPFEHAKNDVTSHCIYQFECTCGHTYIGRTHRSLQVRASEHIPKWLQKQMESSEPINGENRRPSSSIAKHIIETGHKIDVNRSFKPIYKTCLGRILKFVEALAIRKFKPPLCVQKQFVITLNLPW
uniref:Reverse transcriptase domain-containing protein n=1 Tax=Trichobilharzia regenti TaxID=157069 RepID=A0AA85JR94_TRIRE|nr:unnamed protein product [Trichobilharzia regenti]